MCLLVELTLLNAGFWKVAHAPFQLARHIIAGFESTKPVSAIPYFASGFWILHQLLQPNLNASEIIVRPEPFLRNALGKVDKVALRTSYQADQQGSDADVVSG